MSATVAAETSSPSSPQRINNDDQVNILRKQGPCLMDELEHRPKHGQKRPHGTTVEVPTVEPSRKKAARQFSSRREAETAFWDGLSRIHLTTRALRELDRRNRHHTSRRTNLDSRRDWDRYRRPLMNITGQIVRFASHGGPDLTDLRGVRLV